MVGCYTNPRHARHPRAKRLSATKNQTNAKTKPGVKKNNVMPVPQKAK